MMDQASMFVFAVVAFLAGLGCGVAGALGLPWLWRLVKPLLASVLL